MHLVMVHGPRESVNWVREFHLLTFTGGRTPHVITAEFVLRLDQFGVFIRGSPWIHGDLGGK